MQVFFEGGEQFFVVGQQVGFEQGGLYCDVFCCFVQVFLNGMYVMVDFEINVLEMVDQLFQFFLEGWVGFFGQQDQQIDV